MNLLRTAVWILFFCGYTLPDPAALARTQRIPASGWSRPVQRPEWLRMGVFQTDVWVESRHDGSLAPLPRFPVRHKGQGLLDGANFTPEVYLADVQKWLGDRKSRCDVLMYYGGPRQGTERQGLNFNGWSISELKSLQAMGGRPFIGLETTDRALIGDLVERLDAAGFSGSRLFIRITAEPSGSAYGTDDGTLKGRRHCPAAYTAYKKRFGQTAQWLRSLGRRYGIQFQIVFAGDSAEDFDRYLPEATSWDAIGFDLYVTPANARRVIPLLKRVLTRFRDRPVVIPEFGIATEGESHDPGTEGMRASLRWAEATLAQTLKILGHHRGKITQVTLFSVNVAARMPSRRWSWAWTPRMLQMMEEWQHAPAQWNNKPVQRRITLSSARFVPELRPTSFQIDQVAA